MRLLYNILFFFALSITLNSCSSENDFVQDEDYLGPSVRQTSFEPGDAASRSSFEFDGSKLVFQWTMGDKLGIYSTAGKPTVENETPIYDGLIVPTEDISTHHPEYTDEYGMCFVNPNPNQTLYICNGVKDGAQTARISSEGSGFEWNQDNRWTAYYHYNSSFSSNNPQQTKNFDALPFDFTGQKQTGFVNMTAYYNNTDNYATYRASEKEACKHLSDADVMISPETAFDDGKIRFEMRHVGAVARFFLVLPKDKAFKIKKLQLICESKIFHTQGEYSLKSRKYNAAATDENFGLSLVGSNVTNSQVKPVGEPTNMLELEFDETKVVMEPNSSDGDCLIAYLMMYPVTYKKNLHGNLYAYLTAIDPDTNKEVHFVTNPLAEKDMISGKYYQWTTFADPQDGLYPIELTATLLPWQDIIAGGIETDLTK